MATSMRGGGSEHQIAMLARHLPRDEFEVHLYLSERAGELLDELPADVPVHCPSEVSGESGKGRRSLWRRIADRWPGTILRRNASEFADLVQRLQIDVIYDRAFHNTLIAGHRSIDLPDHVRRVSTIVSPPDVALPMVEKRFTWLKRRMLADAYRRSDRVIAVSDAAADSAAAYYGLPRKRIIVIPNPIDIEAVRESAAGVRRAGREMVCEDDPEPARLHFVCVGRMTVEKGQSDLIAAIGKLPGKLPANAPRLTFRFVGDGPERSALRRQWSEMVGNTRENADPEEFDEHRVEFAGLVTPATREIAAADGLILPSHFEGMPNVVLEAFALETPVIATRSGGTVQLQRDTQDPTCFWASVRSPNSLADAIVEFINAPMQRARHVLAAKRLIEKRHTMQSAIRKISAILAG